MWIKDIRDYILYEDKDILVCHKPAGLAVQNARVGNMDMESLLESFTVVSGKPFTRRMRTKHWKWR